MTWLLRSASDAPKVYLSPKFYVDGRWQTRRGNLQYPGRSLLRAPGPVLPGYLPQQINIQIDSHSADAQTDITPETMGDLLLDRQDDVLAVSRRARDTLHRHASLDIAFHEVEISAYNKPPLPGPWYLVDFLVSANVVLENRSNLQAALANADRAGDALFCRAQDVHGLNFWCGASSLPRSAETAYPDRMAGPKLTYCSDNLYKELVAQNLLKGWYGIPIHEVEEDASVLAKGSPLELAQSHRKAARVFRIAPAALTSKDWTGDFDAARNPDGRESYGFYFDDDLPAIPIFEFGGFIFANSEARRIMNTPGLFAETKFYSNPEMTKVRSDAEGYGVMIQPAPRMQFLAGLSRSYPGAHPLVVEVPRFGRVYCPELLAFAAGNLPSLKVWAAKERGSFFADEDTLDRLLAKGLLSENNAALRPVDLYERAE